MDDRKILSSRICAVQVQSSLLQVQRDLASLERLIGDDIWTFTHRNSAAAVSLMTEANATVEKLNALASQLRASLDHLGDVRIPGDE